jgi:hypothetical protein
LFDKKTYAMNLLNFVETFPDKPLKRGRGSRGKTKVAVMAESKHLNKFGYKFNRRYFGGNLFDRLPIAAVSYKNQFRHTCG